MSTIVIAIITAAAAIFASTGFWAFITKHQERDTAEQRLLMGLAHDRLITQTTKYIHRGYITHEEYDDIQIYLYQPYRDKGGNGTVERLMEELKKIEVKPVSDIYQAKKEFYGLSDRKGLNEKEDNSIG